MGGRRGAAGAEGGRWAEGKLGRRRLAAPAEAAAAEGAGRRGEGAVRAVEGPAAGRGRREEPGEGRARGVRDPELERPAAEGASAAEAGVGEGGESWAGGGRRGGGSWGAHCAGLRLRPPEEAEAEDRVHPRECAGGGELPGTWGPLLFPVPVAGAAEAAEQDEGEWPARRVQQP